MKEATWADLGTFDRGLGPPERHGHPLYIRTKRKYAAVRRRAAGLGPIRVSVDICGTLVRGDLPLLNPKVICDPTLPRDSIVAQEAAIAV